LSLEQELAVLRNPTARFDKEVAEKEREAAKKIRKTALEEKYMSPLEKFKLESEQIKDAEKQGVISKERARHLLQVGANQVGNLPTGQFGSMSSRWQEIQGAALKPEDDTQRSTLEELKGLRDLIESFRASGFPIKG